jgi:hypothetical protein
MLIARIRYSPMTRLSMKETLLTNMPLDANDRGVLEKIIDSSTKQFTALTASFRNVKTQLAVKDEREFVYGWAQGYIYGTFCGAFIISKQRQLTDDETSEVFKTIARRGNEIREAIFKAG